jgi:hypothetical protein
MAAEAPKRDALTSRVLGISLRTVKRDWRVARLWLHREMSGR